MAKFLKLLSVLIIATGLAFTGCATDENPTGPDGEGGGDITITVTTGLTPTFSWTGGGVNDLMVERTANQLVVWEIRGPNGTDPISSPVTHGIVPNGATKYSYEEDEDIPLVSGVEYKVSVIRSNGTEGWFIWTPEGGATTATVTGTVKDASNNEPVEGANISCSDSSTSVTTSNGAYTMIVAAGNDRVFTVSKSGYQSVSQTRNITAGQNVTLNFALEPATGETQIPYGFYGTWQHRATVTGGNDLATFPATTLFTIDQHGNWTYSSATTTLHSGTCTWEEYSSDIVHTVYKMTITYTESIDTTLINDSEEILVEFMPGDYATFTYPNEDMVDYLIMPDVDEARFAGFVMNDDMFLEGVSVGGENQTVYAEWNDITDTKGFFFGCGDKAGSYSVDATKLDWEDWNDDFECNLGEVVFIVIEMYPSGGGSGTARIWGRIWDDDTGLSIENVLVAADDASYTMTDQNGHFSFYVDAGYRTLVASKDGYLPGTVSRNMLEDQEYEVNFTLIPSGGGGSITINVTDGLLPVYSWTGGPINDLMIERTANQSVVWGIHGQNGTDPIESPVVHGIVPTGATKYSYEDDEDIPLVGGVEYKVTAIRSNGTYGSYTWTPEGGGSGTGTIHGKITDSQNSNALEGVLVSSDDGPTAITDSEGLYSIIVNEGNRTLTASYEGYYDYVHTIYVDNDNTYERNFTLSPLLGSEGQLRLVLNWGAEPEDLDSYLKTPEIEGIEYTVYYSDSGNELSPPYATLDNDDTDGYGPETITVFNLIAGTYDYWVDNYSGYPDIAGCGAVVNIYDETGRINSITVPENGTGDYWHVCQINGATGEITIVNTISEYEPEGFKNLERPVKPLH